MASPQTAVPSEMLFAVPGQIADMGTAQSGEILSCVNSEASAELAAGLFVCQGTTGSDGNITAKVPVEDGTILGLAVYSAALGHSSLSGDDGALPGVTIPVARTGCYYVMPIDDVTPTSGVHVLWTTVSSDPAGSIRGTADGSDSWDLSDCCKWLSSGGPTSGQCAVLEINLPAGASLITENS